MQRYALLASQCRAPSRMGTLCVNPTDPSFCADVAVATGCTGVVARSETITCADVLGYELVEKAIENDRSSEKTIADLVAEFGCAQPALGVDTGSTVAAVCPHASPWSSFLLTKGSVVVFTGEYPCTSPASQAAGFHLLLQSDMLESFDFATAAKRGVVSVLVVVDPMAGSPQQAKTAWLSAVGKNNARLNPPMPVVFVAKVDTDVLLRTDVMFKETTTLKCIEMSNPPVISGGITLAQGVSCCR